MSKEDRFLGDAAALIEPGESPAHVLFCASKDTTTGQNIASYGVVATERAIYSFWLKGSGVRGRVRELQERHAYDQLAVGRTDTELVLRSRDEQSWTATKLFVPRYSRDELERLVAHAEAQGALRDST